MLWGKFEKKTPYIEYMHVYYEISCSAVYRLLAVALNKYDVVRSCTGNEGEHAYRFYVLDKELL
jgi:hypothetical protein